MRLEKEQTCLRVHLRNTDKYGKLSATDHLVECARREGLAGATTFRGLMGLDATGNLLESRWWSFIEHVPVIIEIVDDPDSIGRFLSVVQEVDHEGLATLAEARVHVYRRGRAAAHLTSRTLPHSTSSLPLPEDFSIMELAECGVLLRVLIDGAETRGGEPLFRSIVLSAREEGLAWATVLRDVAPHVGSDPTAPGKVSPVRPVVVELVGSPTKVQAFLPLLDLVVDEGVITAEEIRVLKFGQRNDT